MPVQMLNAFVWTHKQLTVEKRTLKLNMISKQYHCIMFYSLLKQKFKLVAYR